MVLASCGALPLICAVFVYFVLIAKMYEDYLEEFVFKTTKIIAEKLFGKKSNDDVNQTSDSGQTTHLLAIRPEQATSSVQNANDETENVANESNKSESENGPSGNQATNANVEEKETETVREGNGTTDAVVAQKSDVAAIERENSFEVLYNQLDPVDIAEMTEPEPEVDPNETEEERQKKIALEAGWSQNWFSSISLFHCSHSLSRSLSQK